MDYGQSGFISDQPVIDDMPAAMESEVYVNGELQMKNKKKKNGKSTKGRRKDENYCAGICGYVRLLWATRQTEDIDKVNNPDKFVKVTLRELIIYIFFLVVVCLMAFGMISSSTFTFGNGMLNSFVETPATTSPYLTFATLTQMADIWTYLNDPFIRNFNFEWYANTASESANLTGYLLIDNRLLGLARLRQLRVLNNSCTIPTDFQQEIKVCYSDYSSIVEDTNPYGPYLWYNVTNDTAWYWQSEAQLGGTSFQGQMNTYAGSGYVKNLADNAEETLAIISNLFNNLWIDRATRAVFLDFTVYNANINLFCQVKLVFELPATGGVVPTYVIRPVKLLRYVSSFDYFILACEIIFCVFVFYYTIEEMIEIKKHKLQYFTAIWNILDVVILLMSYVCIAFNVYRTVKVDQVLVTLLGNDNQFYDFEFLCYWQTQFNNTIAAIVFIAWIKIFKYLSFNKTMTQLSMTLSRCAKDVAGFAIMFFIVFLAYAQLGYLIFGTQVYDFSTFSFSIYTLFRIILGDFDFESLEAANRVLGPIFFLTYVFFVFFVLLNMFIAIINDTYGEIKSELANQKSEIELAHFFKKGYGRVLDKLNLKHAQIIDIQKAITNADLNKDNKIDFIEWRNSLRAKGYGDTEIETLFAKYDVDGDRVLNEEEQKNMLKDLSEQNEELKKAYKALESAKEKGEGGSGEGGSDKKKKNRGDGVLFEDYTFLNGRIEKMETAIGSIVNKVDSVLAKLENVEAAKKKQQQQQQNNDDDNNDNSQSVC